MASDNQKTWDDCLTNFGINTGVGLGAGILLSLLFFKRKAPVIFYGAGIGGGYSYYACEENFKKLYSKIK
ncbi:unnamed protein product [Blepharisma stoltei]|uniref:MICOS complex subunit MIC10 n=1 Tax=Blepharisma stoltei TaxID=1481888 RepID=A0AAU9JIH6_9CILI|nr:unnamed protein product [Blepharisma stoltei]